MIDQIITREGYEKLKRELDDLCTTKRQQIATRIETAKELGDLSENAEYHQAKEEQAFNEGRILEISSLIKNLKIVETNNGNGKIDMGSVVTAVVNGTEKQYTIVSFNEADPATGKISNESPLGRCLIGRKKGDIVKATAPKGEIEYKILRVE